MKWHMITKPGCQFCTQAKQLLDIKGITYTVDHRETPEQIQAFIDEGHRTFPRIFLDDRLIGGFTDLQSHFAGQPSDDF